MKIIELRAENVMRLKAVEITPDGTVQVIGGRNAQGKSAVLNAIWLALGGGKASKDISRPIRDGEEKASVRLDLGDLVVTRTWTQKGTSLKVENAEGATFKSPQGMLDALVGQLSFDPLAFTRLSAKEQRAALLDLVDLDVDLDTIDAQIRDLYTHRTEIGRKGAAIGDVTVDDKLPTVETSAASVVKKLQEAQEVHRWVDTTRNQIIEAKNMADKCAEEIRRLETRIHDLNEQIAALRRTQQTRVTEAENMQHAIDNTEMPNLAYIEDELATVEDTNAKIRANNAARERLNEKQALRDAYEGLTKRLTELDEQKAAALADATFPVEGLSFDESGVLFQGVPLSQASSAEQIRVSLAMGMALNPKLRVLMIKDGSLLDEDSMAAIRDQVADGDFQLWLEIVNPDDPTAVLIEDGQVADR